MKYHFQDDWLPPVGEAVQIRHNNRILRTGTVDSVTSDGSILWVAASGPSQRQMIARDEGFEVWVTYRWESSV